MATPEEGRLGRRLIRGWWQEGAHLRWLYDKLIRPIVTAHDTPEAIAGGLALGLAVALTPTLGIQMPIAVFAATCCGFNRVVAVAMVWISNPLTALPLYYVEYRLGVALLRAEALSFDVFSEQWTAMSGLGYLERFRVLFNVLREIAVPLLVGSGASALVLGSLTYPVALAGIRWRRARRARRGLPTPGLVVEKRPDEASDEETADEGASATGDAQPSTRGRRHLAIVVLAASLGATSCAQREGGASVPGVPEEALSEGRLDVWHGQTAAGVLVTVGPFHAVAGRDAFARGRFDDRLRLEPGAHEYFALDVYGLGAETLVFPGSDGLPVEIRTSEGRVDVRRPSTLLEGAEPGDRALLAALLGPGTLPDLEPGRSLRLLLVVPRSDRWVSVDVTLAGETVRLTRSQVAASDLAALRGAPTMASWQEALRSPVEESE